MNLEMPDYIGFVFAPSKRQISFETALNLKGLLKPQIKSVGVFVNADVAEIQRAFDRGIIDMAQLHGAETSEYISRLKMPVIKAVNVGDKTPENADYLLFDNGAGGTGEAFDWALLPKTTKQFFLAGGLRPDNVAQAIRVTRPFAVDVSSGVETEGVKDAVKIREFMRRAREC